MLLQSLNAVRCSLSFSTTIRVLYESVFIQDMGVVVVQMVNDTIFKFRGKDLSESGVKNDEARIRPWMVFPRPEPFTEIFQEEM